MNTILNCFCELPGGSKDMTYNMNRRHQQYEEKVSLQMDKFLNFNRVHIGSIMPCYYLDRQERLEGSTVLLLHILHTCHQLCDILWLKNTSIYDCLKGQSQVIRDKENVQIGGIRNMGTFLLLPLMPGSNINTPPKFWSLTEKYSKSKCLLLAISSLHTSPEF